MARYRREGTGGNNKGRVDDITKDIERGKAEYGSSWEQSWCGCSLYCEAVSDKKTRLGVGKG